MSEEVDRNDPELKYLSVERNQFNDPATQAEWTQKRLVWVPHENQVSVTYSHSPLPAPAPFQPLIQRGPRPNLATT